MMPCPLAQHRPHALVIAPGLHKVFRLAMRSGDRFEVVAEFDTLDQAGAAKRAAEAASAFVGTPA